MLVLFCTQKIIKNGPKNDPKCPKKLGYIAVVAVTAIAVGTIAVFGIPRAMRHV